LNYEYSKVANFTSLRDYSGRRATRTCSQSHEDQKETWWHSSVKARHQKVLGCF